MEPKYEWNGAQREGKKDYTCSYCDNLVASEFRFARYATTGSRKSIDGEVYICPFCNNPTFFPNAPEIGRVQIPGPRPCTAVSHLPESINSIYEEARNCLSAGASVGAALCARKVVMNLAVSKGAELNKRFAYYVDYLVDNNHIPKDVADNLDHVRTKGNEAAHELPAISYAEALELIAFLEMLLRFLYEFPAATKIRREAAQQSLKGIGEE